MIAATLLATCDRDETLAAYGAAEASWRLDRLDGAPFTARATLSFPAEGVIAGQGPCNSFSGQQTEPYPWFGTGPLRTTRRACPELAAEQAFLAALRAMSLAEVQGDTLILSNDAGREMIFVAEPE
ncbi:META domain-containing protein [Marinovum sp.]|uniref:META domain-containing protein n=1 Tax=Marinovum sp. TaxID=2024839 RepID=UPI002B264FDB|nr:META domain-containing protein [Marinovum sp.]